MSAEMEVGQLVAARRRGLDRWAGERAILDLPLAHMWESGDWFPWGMWQQDIEGDLPEPVATYRLLRAAQDGLRASASPVTDAVEAGNPELPGVDIFGERIWIALSVDSLTDVHEALMWLGDAGVLRAMGFLEWPERIGAPHGRHDLADLGFGASDTHAMRCALACTHIHAQATNAAATVLSPKTRRKRLAAHIRSMRSGSNDRARCLVRFAVDAVVLAAALRDPRARSPEALDTLVVSILRDGDDPDAPLSAQSTPRSYAGLAGLLQRDLEEAADDLANWEARHEGSSNATRRSRRRAEKDLADYLVRYPLRTAVSALANLRRGRIADLLDPPKHQRRLVLPEEAPTSQWVAVAAFDHAPDWQAARRHVERSVPADLRPVLLRRIDELDDSREPRERTDYETWSIRDQAGGKELVIETTGPRVAALAALQQAGASRAAGCVATNVGSLPPDQGFCPRCGGLQVADVAIGFPTPEMEQQAARGELILAGDALDAGALDADTGCRECGHRWRRHRP